MTDGQADEHMHGRTVARTHACTHACPQVHPISVGGKTFYDLDLATAKRLFGIPLHHDIMLHKICTQCEVWMCIVMQDSYRQNVEKAYCGK